jgi:oxalate/formate antiporter
LRLFFRKEDLPYFGMKLASMHANMRNKEATLQLRSARWVQLGVGLVAMMTISSPQYVWTLFVKPLQAATGASLTGIQVTISLLIVLQTWLSPLQGTLIERFGPRPLVMAGCALSGLGWVLAAHAGNLVGLYLSYGLFCGVGTGIVYVGIVGHMVRWFPDRRGFATGVVAAGYGFGAMLTTFPIAGMLAASGYKSALTVFGLILGAVGVLAALLLRVPPAAWTKVQTPVGLVADRDVASRAMLRTPVFWLMFAMMTMVSTGGLMVIVQFSSFSRDFGIGPNVLVWGLAALPLALTLDRVTNGLTRPVFGAVSDRIGRENTMAVAFIGEALAIVALLAARHSPTAYVLMSGVVFFGWGEIFSLFPSTLTDTFGTVHATSNYGFLYMAQGIGSVLGGPVAAAIHGASGSWMPVFGLIVAMDLATGLLAVLALKPLRRQYQGAAPMLAAA